ncbi:alpha/beta hydrolase [Mesorhizobium sp. YR577]|uniref:alpha/beta fold hydrolase n=1 Tax=Mesorhizobium sp. YR577 TaxID=1884373 RepID=UPI0008EB38D7|nr:alpha/beta hydrolase [Mesorhizobium sp. YR577]SFU21947.1 Pimeloyl-ACP methyl ester carboxylesterase [Mesorhizobium sp. YR577]
MNNLALRSACAALLISFSSQVLAAPAIEVLGRDFTFPNQIEGVPGKLSDFSGLEINSFETNDGVKLSYWEAGEGRPIIFVPGWGANGAEYFNVMSLLSKKYRVLVLDPRNQGLSENVDHGTRIARYGMDLKEFVDHLGLEQADLCGWSMGASVVWSYIDLFGTKSIRKAAFIDEPISIYTHADWTEEERLNAGGMTTSPERMIAAFAGAPTNSQIVDMNVLRRAMENGSQYFQNSEAFAHEFIRNDMKYMSLVLFDHATNDWRDVVSRKIDVPTAIFTGENSNNVPSQKWMQSQIKGSELFIYSAKDEGDHFLAFKNPVKFTNELSSFLER